jgi:hypothetical protein
VRRFIGITLAVLCMASLASRADFVVSMANQVAAADTQSGPLWGPSDGSTEGVPSDCFPHPGLPGSAAAAAAVSALAARNGQPLKDLAIQPASLSHAQWGSLLTLAHDAHVDVIELAVNWTSYEPNGPAPTGEFSRLSRFVDAVRSMGMEVRFQLFGFPTWARDAGEPSAANQPWLAPEHADELERWSGFVDRVVSKFGTDVSYYEIWNEENTTPFWPQGPDPVAYSNLLACSYVSAKQTNPEVTIVSGGLSTNDVGFLDELYTALDRFPDAVEDDHFFDVLGVHPYSGDRGPEVDLLEYVVNGPFGPDDENFLGLTNMQAAMAANGDGDKRIYVGEYGWPVTGFPEAQDNGFMAIPEAERASWLSDAYGVAAGTGDVLGMSWYTFYPTAFDGPAWALVRNPDGSTNPTTQWQQTPSFQAYANVP